MLPGLALLQTAGGLVEAAMLIVALEAKLLSMRTSHIQGLQPGKLLIGYAAASSYADGQGSHR